MNAQNQEFTRVPQLLSCAVQGHEARLTLRLPANLIHFEGHFPEVPILPGVAQLAFVMKYALEHLAVEGDFLGLTQLKFHTPLRPLDEMDLHLQWQPEKRQLRFSYRLKDRTVSSGALRFS